VLLPRVIFLKHHIHPISLSLYQEKRNYLPVKKKEEANLKYSSCNFASAKYIAEEMTDNKTSPFLIYFPQKSVF